MPGRVKVFCARLAVLASAMSVAVLCGSGCGKKETYEEQDNEPVVNLKAIVMGTVPTEGMDELYRQLDALTVPELGCTLRFDFIPWGNERKQLNIAIASGEYDLIPGGVFSDYRTLVSKNAFLDLKEYLYLVPELCAHYEDYQEDILKNCEIGGGLYGIPQFAMGVKDISEGFFYREDLRQEWNLEPITDFATMEAYLYRAKEDARYQEQPLVTDNRIWTCLWIMLTKGKYLEINSKQETPFVVVEADHPSVLLNRMETPEFAELVRIIRRWQEDGILESDMLALSDNEGERGKRLMVADLKPCETNSPVWSVGSNFIPDLYESHPEWEFGFFSYASCNGQWVVESMTDASVISISSKTKDPEKAVRLLEKIHTDQRYYDLLRYGVEGIHYRMEDGKLDFTGIGPESRFGWTPISDSLLSYDAIPIDEQWYLEAEQPHYQWAGEIFRLAGQDPLDGFSFDATGLGAVIGRMEEVRLQYFQPVLCGYQEDCDGALKQANEALYEAGFGRYLEAMQQQLAAFLEGTGED